MFVIKLIHINLFINQELIVYDKKRYFIKFHCTYNRKAQRYFIEHSNKVVKSQLQNIPEKMTYQHTRLEKQKQNVI